MVLFRSRPSTHLSVTADVEQPILGADFLAHFNLLDMTHSHSHTAEAFSPWLKHPRNLTN